MDLVSKLRKGESTGSYAYNNTNDLNKFCFKGLKLFSNTTAKLLIPASAISTATLAGATAMIKSKN